MLQGKRGPDSLKRCPYMRFNWLSMGRAAVKSARHPSRLRVNGRQPLGLGHAALEG
jgi:hypothetical protein